MVDAHSDGDECYKPPQRTWRRKFGDAFRGLACGVRGQSSFVVHLFATVAVLIAAAVLRLPLWQWCVLLLCIALVLTAELFNSALERMAKQIDRARNPALGEALDIASAAVLVASIGAAVIGAAIFIVRIFAQS
jgi:diacylglycerol kinase